VADAYEVLLTIDLRDDLSEAELAEVRWHLGLGPQPAEVTIVTTTYPMPADDGSWPEVPLPVFAGEGAPTHVHGAEVSAITRRDAFGPPGWGITARQEVHVDGIEDVRTFVEWLARHADYPYSTDGVLRQGGHGNFIGYLRRFDWDKPEFITIRDYEVDWSYYT
jgi:hypothetical protein